MPARSVLAKAYLPLLLLFGVCVGPTAGRAQGAWDTVTAAGQKAVYQQIERSYLTGERTAACDREALAAGQRWLHEGLHPADADAAAEKVFRLADLALRLSAQRELLHALADSVYAHVNVDTSRRNRAQLLLALACVELNRGEYHLSVAAIDSALRQGRGLLMVSTEGGCHNIRGFAYAKLGRHDDAYFDFRRAAEVYRAGGLDAGLLGALEASAREAVLTGRFAEALAATEEAIAILVALPRGEQDVPEAYNVYLSRAKALAAVGRGAEALAAVQRGSAIAAARQDRPRVIAALIASAEVDLTLGRHEESVGAAGEALAMAKQYGQDHLHYEALVALGRALEADGRYAEALAISAQLLLLKDTLDARRLSYGLADLRARHDQQAVRQQLTLLAAEKRALTASRERIRTERWAFGLATLAGIAVIAGVIGQLRARRVSEQRLQTQVALRTAEIATQQADLLAQAERLRRSNAELERFAYIASHDLKTPIRSVSSFLQLIERRLAPEARAGVQEYLDLASGSARQMHALVTDVLEFSRLDVDLEASSCAVDLAGLLDKLRRQLAPQLDARGGTLEVGGSAEAWGPPNYLSQLFTNLIENGLKYNRSACPRVQVRIASAGEGWTEVLIADNGIGIAAEYHDRVFEMFKRLHTTDEFQGTGLGLAVCKKVVERLGGGITLASAEGEGSTFTVRLPAKPARAQVVSRREELAYE